MGANGRPKHGLKSQNANKLSPDKSMMPLSYDLEISPKYLAPNISNGPKYRPCNPHSNGDIGPRKTHKIGFRQNGGEHYFRFRFLLHIPILHGRLGR